MAVQKGSSFLLKDNSGGSAVTIGGLRSTSMTINGEMVDVTNKDSSTFSGSNLVLSIIPLSVFLINSYAE